MGLEELEVNSAESVLDVMKAAQVSDSMQRATSDPVVSVGRSGGGSARLR